MRDRKHRPVFVMGCPRSGTNLLYDTLLSSGGFAIYRGRLPVHQVLIPYFGRLDRAENRRRMMDSWSRSEGFRKSGLNRAELSAEILNKCRNGGDFLAIVMNNIARSQQLPRWAVYDPDTVLRVATLKKEIPEALFVHIIRDGRDVALSLRKLGCFRPFPWSERPGNIEETALYWEWMVLKGRCSGDAISEDYLEVRYEDLIAAPHHTLRQVGQFLDHDLDYERIRAMKLGTLSKSNSSFRGDVAFGGLSPVLRWKQMLSQREIASLEWLVGETLDVLGYGLADSARGWKPGVQRRWLRTMFPTFLELKQWLKINTAMGRLSSLADLQLSAEEKTIPTPTPS